MKSFGIFGGSFDPIHEGHLFFAREAAAALSLDKVLFVPAAQNPLKPVGTHASGEQRAEMIRLAIGKDPLFELCDLELRRPPPSYTIDTVEQLQSEREGKWFLLMGTEVYAALRHWKRPEDLLRKVTVHLVDRVSSLPFSSTQIRTELAMLPKAAWDEPMPPVRGLQRAVWQYIKENKALYRS